MTTLRLLSLFSEQHHAKHVLVGTRLRPAVAGLRRGVQPPLQRTHFTGTVAAPLCRGVLVQLRHGDRAPWLQLGSRLTQSFSWLRRRPRHRELFFQGSSHCRAFRRGRRNEHARARALPGIQRAANPRKSEPRKFGFVEFQIVSAPVTLVSSRSHCRREREPIQGQDRPLRPRPPIRGPLRISRDALSRSACRAMARRTK
jgi:hypothetical protein